MHLLRLNPDQISKHWKLLRHAIVNSYPPTEELTDSHIVAILQQLLSGKMQAWAANSDEYPVKVWGIMTTVILDDFITGTKSLLLWSAFSWHNIPDNSYAKGFLTLKKFALSEGCKNITFISANERLAQMAQKVGFLVEYKFGVIKLT